MSQIGKLEAFHLHEDNWQEYWDMVEQYFIANGIETFLTVIGRGLLFSLTAQRKPSSMKVDELKNVTSGHFTLNLVMIAERYTFYNRVQTDDESIADFIAELERLSLHGEFQTFLEQALRDKFATAKSMESA